MTVVRRKDAAPARQPGTVLRPAGGHRAAGPGRRRWLPWLAAGLAAATVGGIAAFAVQASGGGGDGGPGALVTASLSDQSLPTGLLVTRHASYDPAEQAVELRFQYDAGTAPLAGPFLEVIPPADEGGQCPLVAWEGPEQPANVPANTGVEAPCGFAVDVGSVPAQGRAEVTATVSLALPDEHGALEAWLQEASDETAAALAQVGTGPAYPVQRLVGVAVQAQPLRVEVNRPVDVSLYPVWRGGGGSADWQNPLVVSSSIGPASDLLRQVAGGYDGVRLFEQCDGRLEIDGRRAVAVRPGTCRVEATLGTFTGLRSSEIHVVGPRS